MQIQPLLLVSCSSCRRLHEPPRSDAAHPLCAPCTARLLARRRRSPTPGR